MENISTMDNLQNITQLNELIQMYEANLNNTYYNNNDDTWKDAIIERAKDLFITRVFQFYLHEFQKSINFNAVFLNIPNHHLSIIKMLSMVSETKYLGADFDSSLYDYHKILIDMPDETLEKIYYIEFYYNTDNDANWIFENLMKFKNLKYMQMCIFKITKKGLQVFLEFLKIYKPIIIISSPFHSFPDTTDYKNHYDISSMYLYCHKSIKNINSLFDNFNELLLKDYYNEFDYFDKLINQRTIKNILKNYYHKFNQRSILTTNDECNTFFIPSSNLYYINNGKYFY